MVLQSLHTLLRLVFDTGYIRLLPRDSKITIIFHILPAHCVFYFFIQIVYSPHLLIYVMVAQLLDSIVNHIELIASLLYLYTELIELFILV